MIFGKKEALKNYKGFSKNLDMVIENIENGDHLNLPVGKTELNSDLVIMNIQEPTTKDRENCTFEIHKEHVDLHLILEGEEVIGFSSEIESGTIGEYNETEDYQLFAYELPKNEFLMKTGTFMFLLPGEFHMPSMNVGGKNKKFKKVVYKIIL